MPSTPAPHAPVRIQTVEDLLPHILYEDEDLLVLHKPAGIAVQSKDVMKKDLNTLLLAYFPSRFVGIVQRLDQPVEGILVFGKNPQMTARLHDQISGRQVEKYYQAVVVPREGAPVLVPGEEESHELTDWLLKTPGSNISHVVPKETPGAKQSYLSYRTLQSAQNPEGEGEIYLLSVKLGTGRHHQIRVQLSHANLPILGDMKYGVSSYIGLGLCATSLTLAHPRTGETLHFEKNPDGACFAPFA